MYHVEELVFCDVRYVLINFKSFVAIQTHSIYYLTCDKNREVEKVRTPYYRVADLRCVVECEVAGDAKRDCDLASNYEHVRHVLMSCFQPLKLQSVPFLLAKVGIKHSC